MQVKPYVYRRLNYGDTHIYEREDGNYALDVCITWAELGLVTASDAYEATVTYAPWRNPLRWVTVGVARGQEPLRKLAHMMRETGSLILAMDSYPVPLSLIGLRDRDAGGFGSAMIQGLSMVGGSNLVTTGAS